MATIRGVQQGRIGLARVCIGRTVDRDHQTRHRRTEGDSVYIEDVMVHLSSTAAACLGTLNVTFEPDHDLLAREPGSVVTRTLYGHRVEVLPTGWVRVHVSRDRDGPGGGKADAWDKGDVWLAPGEVVALTRIWSADGGPPGGEEWEASWGTRRGEGQ
jgi:hypothetical protein